MFEEYPVRKDRLTYENVAYAVDIRQKLSVTISIDFIASKNHCGCMREKERERRREGHCKSI